METLNSPVLMDDPELKRSAAIAKALGHPARIAILKLLAQRDT